MSDGPLPVRGTLRCGPLWIDRRSRRVRTLQGAPVTLGSRALDLLLALVDAAGQPVPAQALKQRVWPGREISGNNLRVQTAQLRRLLGRDAVLYRPGLGYQLTLPVAQQDEITATETTGHLPDSPWAVLGRDALLQSLSVELATVAGVLSLVGPAGVGKTTLALAAARRMVPPCPDGAWWVDLAPLQDPQLLVQTVAAALQLPAAQPLQGLVAALARRRQLLVLDNCEHLRAAVAELAEALSCDAPGVTLLATSRVALGCVGERVWPVPALSLPEPEAAGDAWTAARASGAAAVFESRVRAADPRFRLTADNAALVLDICRRLDGNALAMALAAAQVPVLGLQRLRERLDRRLRWTQRRGSDAPAHHLSLQATLDWTHELLPAAARELWCRLGVCHGHVDGRALAALAAVEPVLDTAALEAAIDALEAHGVVTVEHGQPPEAPAGRTHYRLHESARLYARQRLQQAGQLEAVQGALARWMHQCLQADARASGKPIASADVVQRLMSDLPAAVEWSATHDLPLGAELVYLCSFTWQRQGLHGLIQRLCELLMPGAVAAGLADAQLDLLFALMGTEFQLKRLHELVAHTDAALALMAGRAPHRRQALALSWKGAALSFLHGPEASVALDAQALAIFRAVGDAIGERQTQTVLGWKLVQIGRHEEARQLLHEALQRCRDDGLDWDLMAIHTHLAELELVTGHHDAAAAHCERVLALARPLPDHLRLAAALVLLTQARLGPAGTQAPLQALREAMDICVKLDFPAFQADIASVSALLMSRRGQHRLALSNLGYATAFRQRLKLQGAAASRQAEAEVMQRSGSALPRSLVDALQAQGALLTQQELIERIRALE